MKKIWLTYLITIAISVVTLGQTKLVFDGQLSAYGNYSPDSDMDFFFGGRYLPLLGLEVPLKKTRMIDFEVSANIYGSVSFNNFDSIATKGDIGLYRLWGRYTAKQIEVRLGMQKIDFGSAMLLRPLQWFDEIDPRDPLKFTNGVYAALGRYYFLNNANIWLWVLYGNENPRGFQIMGSDPNIPEFGGRFQSPVPKGEIAFTYHHRTADSEGIPGIPQYEEIPENNFGLDGKWDLGVGLWFEATHSYKTKNVGIFTNQTYLEIGIDYTFGLGNGLHVVLEHLLSSLDEKAFQFSNTTNVTATQISYPLGLYNTISTVMYYSLDVEEFSFFINYQHNFKFVSAYVMAFYNPTKQNPGLNTDFANLFPGPGMRLMIVFNH